MSWSWIDMTEVSPHDKCTGCSACAAICPKQAITLAPDEWGFPRVQIDQSLCIDCGACVKVCPALQEPRRRQRLDEEAFYAAYHRDELVRSSSSSGGAFTALAEAVLRNHGAVCGAALSKKDWLVRHVVIERREELEKLRGSKYAQSRVGDVFSQVKQRLQSGQTVLFSGTPCQVAGLHLFLKREYEHLITVDIVCHGVPAPGIFVDYVGYMEGQYGAKMLDYDFRDKHWSWFRFNMKATFDNGRVYYGKWEEDKFFRGFLGDYYLREACYSCPYSKNLRYSDITLSDFWGYNRKHGGFKNDDKGISMVMLNTRSGQALFQQAKKDLVLCERPRGMSLTNGGFSPREQSLDERSRFLAELKKNGFAALSKEAYFAPHEVIFPYNIYYKYGAHSFRTKCILFLHRLGKPFRRLRKSLFGKK